MLRIYEYTTERKIIIVIIPVFFDKIIALINRSPAIAAGIPIAKIPKAKVDISLSLLEKG